MGVSENRGTPKSSIFTGISIINHPFWCTTIFGNPQIKIQILKPLNWTPKQKTCGPETAKPYSSLVAFRCDQILRQTQHVRLKYDKNWKPKRLFLLLSGSSWRDASQHRTVCSDVRLEMLVVFTVPVLTSTQSTHIWQIAVWNWKLTVGRRYDVDRCTPGTRLTCIGSLAWRFPERS